MTEPLRISRHFFKGHGLGNDYLVFRAEEDGWPLSPEAVRRICHREEGVGSDGIVVLVGRSGAGPGPFLLRMFNPDGSEFERSGNGLRVLGAFLLAEGEVGGEPFLVESGGDRIEMEVVGEGPGGVSVLTVEMGRASLAPESVHLDPERTAEEGGGLAHPDLGAVDFQAVSVGNPHCVVFTEEDPEESVDALGLFLAVHPAFREGTNVQVVRVAGERKLRIAIWERGVGRTAASGTSSCAAAVASVARGLVPAGEVEVEMAGGALHVTVTEELDVVLRGPVQEVFRGELSPAFAEAL